MAIRAQGQVTSTVYHYEIGPDGRRYITGATVTYREDERDSSVGRSPSRDREPRGETESFFEDGRIELTEESKARLKAVEREVIAHEAAHKAVGGQYAGPVSYTYATAPDGTRYIVGGEVSISAPEGRTPEETIQIMEQVKRAALAPGDPSPQDLQVAAAASAAQMRARAELARQNTIEAYESSNKLAPSQELGFAITA
ncbi:MAG: hypothetical protein GX181_06585 [Synergistaceae bacterium]|nr:hypothetical protein [Synergistaceae bacterium]